MIKDSLTENVRNSCVNVTKIDQKSKLNSLMSKLRESKAQTLTLK